MIEIYGTGLQAGIAEGPIFIYKQNEIISRSHSVVNPREEVLRLDKALEKAEAELHALIDIHSMTTDIIEAQIMIMKDPEYQMMIKKDILENLDGATTALINARDTMCQIFEAAGDDYFSARISDIDDVTNRLIRLLSDEGVEPEIPVCPSIILANDIMPSELIRLAQNELLGLVLCQGSEYGHTAIIAKSMGIPYVIKADINKGCMLSEYSGKRAIIDGTLGKLIIEPSRGVMSAYESKRYEEKQCSDELADLIDEKDITMDGREVMLYANINGENDLSEALRCHARGVGLYRSEFLYLGENSYPSEDKLFKSYKKILVAMDGKRTIIRTLDIGYDKCADYMDLKQEENPALGMRGIRFCLENEAVFRRELRALYRASVYGKLAIMFPMISSIYEVRAAKKICESVAMELAGEGIAYNNDIQIGIMIETPAAVMIADELAREVDFFSIGTNDLNQYTLALERNHDRKLDRFCDASHKALLRMINLTIDAAHSAGIWVGICGELAANASILKELIRMGIDEVSVSPCKILEVRKEIRNLRTKE